MVLPSTQESSEQANKKLSYKASRWLGMIGTLVSKALLSIGKERGVSQRLWDIRPQGFLYWGRNLT
jgi:hypothetical protein